MTIPRLRLVCLLVVGLAPVAGACAGGGDAADHAPVTRVVDSALPIPEQLRRFQAAIGDSFRTDTFRFAAPTRDSLIRAFVAALNRRDTLQLRKLKLSRAEFAWLYYADHPLSKPPYEMPPWLLWSQTLQTSEDGAVTALREFGGRGFRLQRVTCAEGEKRLPAMSLWERCVIRVVGAARDTVESRFFGTIVGRDGRFKFVSYGNDL